MKRNSNLKPGKPKLYAYEYPRPAVTVDCVLFGRIEGELVVLLIKRKGAPFRGRWALPGGFAEEGEDLIDSARRELLEETGIKGVVLTQFGAFGKPGRDPRGWTVSIAFSATVDPTRISTTAASDASAVKWHPLRRLPKLAFDHAEVIRLCFEGHLSRNMVILKKSKAAWSAPSRS